MENATANWFTDQRRHTITHNNNNSNVEELNVSEAPEDILTLFGPSHPDFNLIHYTALVCLFISLILGVYIFIYLLKYEGLDFFRWKIGKVTPFILRL